MLFIYTTENTQKTNRNAKENNNITNKQNGNNYVPA